MTLDWNTLAVSLGATATTIAVFAGGPLKWLDNRRKEDRDFVASEVADIREKIADEIADVEAAAAHARNNHKALDQSCVKKFELHAADIVRLTENQKQTSSIVSELKAEMRLGFSDIKHDNEKRHDAFLAMLKSESERQRDAFTVQFAALSDSIREIRKASPKS